MRKKSIIALISMCTIFLLNGCTSFQPVKAPCDQWATGCGQKTMINQW